MTKLGEVAGVRMGFSFRSRIERDAAGSLAVIQMKDIDEADLLHVEQVVRVSLPDVKDHHLVKKGDLVFRSRGQTNSAALVSVDIGPTVLAAPMLLIRPVGVLPEYLRWYINLPATQALLASQAAGTSVRMISKAALDELEIPLPSRRKQELIGVVAGLAVTEQQLMSRIAAEHGRLVDGALLHVAKNAR